MSDYELPMFVYPCGLSTGNIISKLTFCQNWSWARVIFASAVGTLLYIIYRLIKRMVCNTSNPNV